MDKRKLIQEAYLVSHIIEANGNFPNNSKYPLMVYKGALLIHPDDTEKVIKTLFAQNGYSNAWINGIFNYHHYHSNTHEVLGIFSGKAEVQFGGEHGVSIELDKGDVVVIPAGVAHKCLSANTDFKVVGAYPKGAEYNLCLGNQEEMEIAKKEIENVPKLDNDPVYGSKGHLFECWYKNNCQNV
ncbi:MAG: cupin domain-containing protein [Pedobacter sp.]|nr:cupin domain-containing protein [Pedobacter sp.]